MSFKINIHHILLLIFFGISLIGAEENNNSNWKYHQTTEQTKESCFIKKDSTLKKAIKIKIQSPPTINKDAVLLEDKPENQPTRSEVIDNSQLEKITNIISHFVQMMREFDTKLTKFNHRLGDIEGKIDNLLFNMHDFKDNNLTLEHKITNSFKVSLLEYLENKGKEGEKSKNKKSHSKDHNHKKNKYASLIFSKKNNDEESIEEKNNKHIEILTNDNHDTNPGYYNEFLFNYYNEHQNYQKTEISYDEEKNENILHTSTDGKYQYNNNILIDDVSSIPKNSSKSQENVKFSQKIKLSEKSKTLKNISSTPISDISVSFTDTRNEEIEKNNKYIKPESDHKTKVPSPHPVRNNRISKNLTNSRQ